MKILAIETSCDETALALVEASGGFRTPKFKVLKSAISSQIAIHRPFGGVVPNLAKREHLKNLPILFGEISGIFNFQSIFNQFSKSQLSKFKNFFRNIGLISVTTGPGLEPALWTGIEFAKALHLKAKSYNLKPVLVGTNHMEGHIYSFLLPKKQKAKISNSQFSISKCFPAIALLVSGGHTILLKMDNLKHWKKLGETRDDAAGEAFDKVARLLDLPYPGGPEIDKLAVQGNFHAIDFPRPMLREKNYDFSFSGLKTAVLYYLRDHPLKAKSSNLKAISDVAASFEQAVVDCLVGKTIRAAEEFGARSIFLSGGVAANKFLRETLAQEAKKRGMNFFAPDFEFNTDNAAMIAVAAYFRYLRTGKGLPLRANGNLGI